MLITLLPYDHFRPRFTGDWSCNSSFNSFLSAIFKCQLRFGKSGKVMNILLCSYSVYVHQQLLKHVLVWNLHQANQLEALTFCQLYCSLGKQSREEGCSGRQYFSAHHIQGLSVIAVHLEEGLNIFYSIWLFSYYLCAREDLNLPEWPWVIMVSCTYLHLQATCQCHSRLPDMTCSGRKLTMASQADQSNA